jgi:hypothetical protein
MLDDLGLVPAIEWLTKRFMQRCVVCLTLSVNEPALELPGEPYATVFRIVQESLNNIAKHAAASQSRRHAGQDPGYGTTARGRRWLRICLQWYAQTDPLRLLGLLTVLLSYWKRCHP